MTQKDILDFVGENEMLKISVVEKKAGIPTRSLYKALNGEQNLKPEYIEKLIQVLTPLGLKLKDKFKVVSIINNKGGVAKTTTACNLGAALSRMGKKVLLIDADPQGNLTQHLGYKDPQQFESRELSDVIEGNCNVNDSILKYQENLHIIPSTTNLDFTNKNLNRNSGPSSYKLVKRLVIDKIEMEYDYIFFDLSPSFALITNDACLIASNRALIPVDASEFAFRGINNVINHINDYKEENPNLEILGFLFTKSGRTKDMNKYKEALRSTNYKVFNTEIAVRDMAYNKGPLYGKDIFSLFEDESLKRQEKEGIKKGMEEHTNLATEFIEYV
ncbi:MULTISPECIES: ParA family protein [Flammeovirga]|uniref:AAA family ATPase n=1 Tax=Flammeovirga agarivorans TaxID=2726742 RepID=A0A7X8SN50_9BACT|nr:MULTISPECIES: AAA family ATPase [Flammeovirga]NLR93283.1 AAA family ATPase [Flammeovirga agarivorans]